MNDAAVADPSLTEVGEAAIDIGANTGPGAIEDEATTKDETVGSGIKEEDTTTIDEIIEEAEAAAVAAGSNFGKGNAEEITAVLDSALDDTNKDATVTDVKEEIYAEQVDGSTETIADVKVEQSNQTQIPTKESKKRVRRVGRTPTRKIARLDEKMTLSLDVGIGDNNDTHTSAAADAATVAISVVPEAAGDVAMGTSSTLAVAPPPSNQAVLSKHDEKWHGMFQKLMEFKERNKHTLVPQCYTEDPRLGRWVHYQRVEYWIFQQKGTAKITEERIGRLDNIGFEWDPQKAQWEKMFAKLKEFKKEFSHCRVPKGYDKDWELANWVRNQRLEQANLSKEGKKSRMTPERFKLLDDLGFKWSSPTPARARRNRQVAKKVESSNTDQQKVAISNELTPRIKSENNIPAAVPIAAPVVVPIVAPAAVPIAAPIAAPAAVTEAVTAAVPDGNILETPVAAQAEAITSATKVVSNFATVEANTNENNHGFVEEAIQGNATIEETNKAISI